MKRIVATCIALVASVLFAAAQPAKEPYAPGLGEFMTATQLRHAKLWFAGKENNWDLAAYEIDEIAEGLEDAEKQFPTHDGIPVADMIKANIDPRSFIIATYALCGFANLSSVAIQVGGIGALAPSRKSDLARLGLRAVAAGTMANFMSASIVSMLIK